MKDTASPPTRTFRWFWKNPDRAYVYWQTMLIAAITASCGFNGAHAALGSTGSVWHTVAAVVGAVIPPLFFFAIAEGVLMIWHRSLSRSGTALLGLLVTAAGAGAGVRSFFGLVDFSSRFDVLPVEHEPWLVFMLPLVTDALALGATVALFNLKDAGERKRRVRKLRDMDESIARIGLIPRLKIALMGGAANVPPLPATPQAAPLEEVSVPSPTVTEEVREGSPTAAVEPVVEALRPSPRPSPKPSVKVSVPSPDPALEPFMDAAKWMVEEGVVTRKTPAELAAIIAAVDKGSTPNRIKSELGISPATTAKVSAAWTDWQASHRLVAV